MGREHPVITADALKAIGRYHFPGNVRELKNLIEYALIASRGQEITEKHLHFMEPPIDSASESTEHSPGVSEIEPDNDKGQKSVEPAVAEASKGLMSHSNDKVISQEERIIEYAKANGKIDNTVAQQVLNVDHSRASYLLKKLHKDGLLDKQGQRRWTYYTATT